MARAGRPRSETARCAILETALKLARTRGYANLTMDGIATEGGVGKQTIYRWWPSKAAVVLEALRENARVEIAVPDTGSLRDDLEGFLKNTFESPKRRPGIDGVLRAMMAEAQRDADFAHAFRRDLIEPRREVLRSLFERARARGEIASLDDFELWADVAFGVLWYRLLLGGKPADARLASALSALLARAAGAPE